MALTAIEPEEAERLIAAGARLVDFRDADEHTRERIASAVNQPLARIEQLAQHSGPVILHCRTGMRTQSNGGRLAAAIASLPSDVLASGIELWRSSGRSTIVLKCTTTRCDVSAHLIQIVDKLADFLRDQSRMLLNYPMGSDPKLPHLAVLKVSTSRLR